MWCRLTVTSEQPSHRIATEQRTLSPLWLGFLFESNHRRKGEIMRTANGQNFFTIDEVAAATDIERADLSHLLRPDDRPFFLYLKGFLFLSPTTGSTEDIKQAATRRKHYCTEQDKGFKNNAGWNWFETGKILWDFLNERVAQFYVKGMCKVSLSPKRIDGSLYEALLFEPLEEGTIRPKVKEKGFIFADGVGCLGGALSADFRGALQLPNMEKAVVQTFSRGCGAFDVYFEQEQIRQALSPYGIAFNPTADKQAPPKSRSRPPAINTSTKLNYAAAIYTLAKNNPTYLKSNGEVNVSAVCDAIIAQFDGSTYNKSKEALQKSIGTLAKELEKIAAIAAEKAAKSRSIL